MPKIIVRFVSRKRKIELLLNSEKLNGTCVYINEHLAHKNSQIAHAACLLERQGRIQSLQFSVNYSKRTIKNHHRVLPVVVQTNIRQVHQQIIVALQTANNSNKKKKLSRILNEAPGICAWILVLP